jgi:hypothetical protein
MPHPAAQETITRDRAPMPRERGGGAAHMRGWRCSSWGRAIDGAPRRRQALVRTLAGGTPERISRGLTQGPAARDRPRRPSPPPA